MSMAFEPQNALEKSLVKAATDPAQRPQFYRDLAASDLFVVEEGPPPPSTVRTVLKEDYSLQVRHIAWNGKPCLPVFSSLTRLQTAVQREVGFIALNALEFMKITKGTELILNPGFEFGKEFTKDEIASIIDGTIWKSAASDVVPKESQVMLGQPANYPKELVDALIRYFKKNKRVKRAYLAHFFNPERDEKPHTLIGVMVSDDWDAVMAGAGMIARDVPVPDPPVDFIQITGKGGVEDYLIKDCKPIYEKKLWGIF